jgi:two-component system sensor histidine kinase KdpD
MEERRPSPETMLERAAHEAHRSRIGRLKVFFGAVPGVGKT